VFCASLAECVACCGHDGVRRLLYVEVAERGASSDSETAAVQRALENFVRVMNSIRLGSCEVFPAVVPGEIWSAATLLAAASIAERLGRRLCVRLSSTTGDAKRYKETRYFTEVGLLSYLSLLSQATIFNLSQLTRRDVAMVNESSANVVCAPGAVSELLLEQHFARLSLHDRALGFSISGHAVGRADRYESLVSLSTALIHQSCDAVATCNVVVDALTRSAAQALGIAHIGAIAADMKADLCLYDRPADLAENGDSRDFIKLLAHGKPRDVLIDGAPMVLDGAIVREREQA
jgi:cytosine/adenosine deaminase-related metal-dependent hydrolase